MKKTVAEKYRDIDFSRAKRGAVVKPEPGKTKISIRLNNTVIEFFRAAVDRAGGGNYQTLINDALLEYIHRRSTLDVVRQVVREELAPYALGASPVPSTEWPRLLRVLGRESLARLLGISQASIRRYAATTRETPDEVVARLHWLALIVGDLAGAYNELGIRQWFERKRTQLGGRAPAQLLIGRWKPDDVGPQQVRALSAALSGSPAT